MYFSHYKNKKNVFFLLTLFSINIILNTLSISSVKALKELGQDNETVFSIIQKEFSLALERINFTQEDFNEILSAQDAEEREFKIKELINYKKQRNESKKIALELFHFNKLSKNELFSKDSIAAQLLWKNIEMFCGEHNPTEYLLAKIDRTNSIAGNLALAAKLIQPTTNIQELEKRQNIIKILLENEELFNKLDKIIKAYSQIEEELLSFWSDQTFNNLFTSEFYYPPFPFTKIPDNILNKFLPPNVKHSLNKSPFMLFLLNFFNDFSEINTAINEIYNIKYHWWNFKTELSIVNAKKNNLFFDTNTPIEKATSLGEGLWHMSAVGYQLGQIPISAFHAIKLISHAKEKLDTVNKAHHKLECVAKALNSLVELKNTIDKNDILKEKLNYFDDLAHIINENITSGSTDFDEMLQMLKSNTFNGDNNALFSLLARGKILSTSYLLITNQNKLIDILSVIGQVDADLSVVKLYKEYLNKNATFSFAKYIKTNAPSTNIKGFWTPFIEADKVVINDMNLGLNQLSQNAIITGPNEGGKSTILKSIITALILAQTITISPAKNIEFTPFSYIDTYLNITDDTAAGKSLYKSEVLRVKELLDKIKSLKDNEFSFIIMDEVFNSTNAREGSASSFSIAKYLSTVKNNIVIIASHFSQLTTLEKATNGVFKNYKVTVNKSVENDKIKLSYPFVLQDGESDQTVAIDILEAAGFDKSIIETAKEVLVKD